MSKPMSKPLRKRRALIAALPAGSPIEYLDAPEFQTLPKALPTLPLVCS